MMKKIKKVLPVVLTLSLCLPMCNVVKTKAATIQKFGFWSSFLNDDEGTDTKKGKKKYKKACKSYSYKKLVKKPSKYKGKKIKIKGTIVSVDETLFGNVRLIVDTGKNKYYEVYLNSEYREYDDFRRTDKITVWGKCNGTASYKISQRGKKNKKIKIPAIDGRYQDLKTLW